jgi:DNA replication protein DnaC
MQAVSEALTQIIGNMTASASKEYHCPHCGRYVPPMEIEILGRKHTVQPVCDCEWEQEKKAIEDAQRFHQRKETERLFSISNLGRRFEESTFETFKPRPGTEQILELAKQYVEEFESWGGESLLIWGPPGNGKTHIAAAITNELYKRGYIVVFQSVPELLEKIRGTFNRESRDSENDIMKALLACDLLVLDDIGAEKLTDWVQEIMFRIIDGRYRKKLPILYTSNLQPKELANQVGIRSYDRIVETSIQIENRAGSYRREIAKRRLMQMAGMKDEG